MRHEAFPPFLLHFVWHGIRQVVGAGAFHRRILETAYAVQLRFGHPVQQVLEVFFRFTRKADDEGGSQREIRTGFAPLVDAGERTVFKCRALHRAQDARAGVLERDIQVGQDLAFRHQRNHFIHVRIWIYIM